MKNNFNTNISDNTKLLDTTQTAEYLGITQDTLAVWRCHKLYKLPYIKVGRLVKYRLSDLNNFLNSRVVGGSEDERE
jgi:hypothetical protein